LFYHVSRKTQRDRKKEGKPCLVGDCATRYANGTTQPPIEEQQPRPTVGRSLPLEYSAGEIAVRVQARGEKTEQRAERKTGSLNPVRGSLWQSDVPWQGRKIAV